MQISLIDDSNKVSGFVNSIIFENAETGYKVMDVETEEGDLVTVVGIMPDVEIGEKIEASGKWRTHSTYGEQLEAETYVRSLPDDMESMERYLSSGIIKGVGETLARRIVEMFKEQTFHVLDAEPERLSLVKGISQQKAAEIGEQFAAKAASREAMVYLQELGLTARMAMKIFQVFGNRTVQTVRANPYLLAERVSGIGFHKADEIAFKSGLAPDSPARIRGAIRFILIEAAGEGHTYLPETELMDRLERLIGFQGEIVEDALARAEMDGLIIQKREKDVDRVFLKRYYQAEMKSAKLLVELLAPFREKSTEIDEKLREMVLLAEKELKLSLSEEQTEAVMAAITSGVLIITGGPGTGKTTIIKILLSILDKVKAKYLLAAPTGRAAKRMSEATGKDAQTIHRLLEIQSGVEEDETKQSFNRNHSNPLEADVVIIDEVSMVDASLFSHLLDALTPGMRLVMLGDKDQLPSVGAGNVLRDMLLSEVIPVKRLSHIYRQAEKSDIIRNAHRINQGEPLQLTKGKENSDFFFMHRKNSEDALAVMLDVIKNRFPRFAHCSPIEDIQVLSPMKKGTLGTYHLNEELQKALNPPTSRKKEVRIGTVIFREGDKVIQTKNNYELSWVVKNKFGYTIDEGKGVFNGDIGTILSIRESEITVQFEAVRQVIYDFSSILQLELAYAITIHKSQGTESPVIVLPLVEGPEVLFTRNLLYTAVTRAQKYVIVIGSEAAVQRMIDNNRQIVRYSALDLRIRECRDQLLEVEKMLEEVPT